MKTKFFILGILSLLGIFNLTSAGTIELVGNSDGYNPSSMYINGTESFLSDYTISLGNPIEGDSCGIYITNNDASCYYQGGSDTNCNVLPSGNYDLIDGGMGYCTSVSITSDFINNGGGNGGGIISNGISAFGGIVDKLGNITTEFIPYIIYIFIGILGISLIINAVKYILGYLKGESTSVVKTPYDREGMKARRTRRRRNRRFGKYLKKNYKNENLKFGEYGYNSWRE